MCTFQEVAGRHSMCPLHTGDHTRVPVKEKFTINAISELIYSLSRGLLQILKFDGFSNRSAVHSLMWLF